MKNMIVSFEFNYKIYFNFFKIKFIKQNIIVISEAIEDANKYAKVRSVNILQNSEFYLI